jgi:DNA primase
MKGRIVVTIQDVSGNILGFAGRQYEPSANAAKQYIRQIYGNNPVEAEKKISMWERSKWINETYPKLRHLYNLNYAKDYIRKLNYGIIVEGYFDVLTLVDNGLPNTVAVCSPELSQRHLILLSRYCDHVVVLSDGDERGAGFSETWSNRIEEAGLKHHSIYLPLGYDPDELVLKIGGDKLKDIIESIIGDKNSKLKLNLK